MKLTGIPLVTGLALVLFLESRAQFQWIARGPVALSVSVSAITGSGPQIVAVGNTNKYLTSVDGLAWTQRDMKVSNNLHSIIWAGTQYVAVGGDSLNTGVVLKSPDGIVWTSQKISAAKEIISVVWTGAQLVAVDADGGFYTSPNGVAWSAKKVGGTLDKVDAMVWTGAQIVAVGTHQSATGIDTSYGIVFSSPDGNKWIRRRTGTAGNFSFLDWTGKQMFTLAHGIDQTVPANLTSNDGVNWTNVSGINQRLLDVVSAGSQLVARAEWSIFTSPDGLTWTERQLDRDIQPYTGFFVWTGTRFIQMGPEGYALTSTDAISWASNPSFEVPWDLFSITSSGSQYLAVGRRGVIVGSYDGITWTRRDSKTLKILDGAAWSGQQFIVVGDSGTILSSPDGISWTKRNSGTGNTLYSITWTGSQFVATGVLGTILTSSDGITWTSINSGFTIPLKTILWNNAILVAGGDSGIILSSSDGKLWTKRYSDSTPYSVFSLMWTGAQFYAVRRAGAVLASPDGINWTFKGHVLSANYTSLTALTWAGNEFVAAGRSHMRSGYTFTSPDLINWQTFPPPGGVGRLLNSIIWTGSQLIGVGSYNTISVTPPRQVTEVNFPESDRKYLSVRFSPMSLLLGLPNDMLEGKINLTIYNLTGKKVLDFVSTGSKGAMLVPIPQLSRGRYLLEVVGSKRRIAKSICLIQ